MDAEAGRICELVSEACALLQRVERGEHDAGVEAELEHLRAELRALGTCAGDAEVADVARAVVDDIRVALNRRAPRPQDRAA